MYASDWLTLGIIVAGLAIALVGLWLVMHSFPSALRLAAMAGVALLVTGLLLAYVIVPRSLHLGKCQIFPCDPIYDDRVPLRVAIGAGGGALVSVLTLLAVLSGFQSRRPHH